MPKENNKMQVDIDTLKKQNVNDLLSIKELYKRIEELGEKITQIKYIDNSLIKKLKKEYDNLQKIILDENIQIQLTDDIETINSKLDAKTSKEETKNIQIQLTDDIETINSKLVTKANKTETTNIQQQLNNLVLGAVGNGNNAEVIQARGKDSLLNDRLNNIENGKMINNLSFSKFGDYDNIIDYSSTVYGKRIVGFDASTGEPVYTSDENTIVVKLSIKPYCGTIKLPIYEPVSGQSLLCMADDKAVKNFTYSNLTTNTYDWLTIKNNDFIIDCAKLYNYGVTTLGKKYLTSILIVMSKINNYAYRENGIFLKNKGLMDYSISTYPFATSSTLIKDNRNYRCLQHAIKDINITTDKINYRFFIRAVVVSDTIAIHIATVETNNTVLNVTGIEIKDGLQKINLNEQLNSGCSGYIIIDTSMIDKTLSLWGWNELNYETSGISSNCLSLKTDNSSNSENYTFTLPPKIYGVTNKEIDVYFNNLTTLNLDNYLTTKSGGIGNLNSRNRITLNSSTVYNNANVSYSIFKLDGELLKKVTIPCTVCSNDSNNGITKKCLIIGDSFVASNVITDNLIKLFANDVMNIKLLGTLGSNNTGKHEGRAGWASYDILHTESFNNRTNAFLNNGIFDFSYYISQNNIESPDWVFIQFGINDLWRDMHGTTTVQNLQTIINSIKKFNASIKIGIAMVSPPYLGKFGQSQKYEHYKRLKVNNDIVKTFSNKENENIFIVPINTHLDTIYNFPMTTEQINSRNQNTIEKCKDVTHPENVGYAQISDAYYCFLKNN